MSHDLLGFDFALDRAASSWAWDTLLDERSDGERAQGVVPPVSTNQVAAQLLAALGNTPDMRAHVAFGIGTQGVQAEPTGNVRSLTDVQYTDRRGARVNVEVDRPGQLDNHLADHLRAMQAAIAAGRGWTPQQARSVFTESDARGNIRRVRHAHYVLDGGRVRQVLSPVIQLPRPMSPQELVRSGALNSPLDRLRRYLQRRRRPRRGVVFRRGTRSARVSGASRRR